MGRPVVLDVRFRLGSSTGFADFQRSHVPGASFVDVFTALATTRPDGQGGRHPMPATSTFVAAMRSAGVMMSRPVVTHDDWASVPASRAWWMLRHLGFRDVRVLDGGIAAWTAAGRPIESGSGLPGTGDFSPSSPGLGRLLDATQAQRYAERHLLLDARSAERFHGQNETIDPVAGHIPGAFSSPTLANTGPDGRWLPHDELASRFQGPEFAGLGARTTKPVGTYCGSGLQATHLALALSVAGVTETADVYLGSWSDWITDPARIIEF